MATKNTKTFNKMLEILIKKAIDYYDTTIAIVVMILLFIDTLRVNALQQSFLSIMLFLIIIIIVDIGFNVPFVSNIIQLPKIFNTLSRLLLDKFLKSLLYMIILIQLIITPPEVPISFLISNFASIDYYFLLTAPIITGLYFALFNILKISFAKKPETNIVF